MITAGIVLYNPELSILKSNIDSIYKQVHKLILVDNNSTINVDEVLKYISDYKNIIYIKNDKNYGIASALNQIMDYAYTINSHWVLTLDQDSVCPDNLIAEYLKYTHIPKLAIITPNIIDRNIKNDFIRNLDDYNYVDKCITSASFNNTLIWKEVGKFDEKMFIDFVDFEYSFRVRENGYTIIRVNNVNLLHRLGELEVKTIFGKKVYIGHHNPLRKFYYVRNAIYTHKKHTKLYPLRKVLNDVLKLVTKVVFFEQQKQEKIKSIIKGFLRGLKYD